MRALNPALAPVALMLYIYTSDKFTGRLGPAPPERDFPAAWTRKGISYLERPVDSVAFEELDPQPVLVE